MALVSLDSTFQPQTLESIELEALNAEKHPGFFGEGSSLKNLVSLEGFKSPVNHSNIVLKGNIESNDNSFIKIAAMACDETRLPAGE